MAQAFFVQQEKKLEMEKNNVKETAKLKKKNQQDQKFFLSDEVNKTEV